MHKKQKKQKGDTLWYISHKEIKRPTHYSTNAESGAIKVLLEEYGTMSEIQKQHRDGNIILSPTEKEIVDAFCAIGMDKPRIY